VVGSVVVVVGFMVVVVIGGGGGGGVPEQLYSKFNCWMSFCVICVPPRR